MPKTRATCCMCQNTLEINGDRYNGIKFNRSTKRIDAISKHLGLSLKQMGIFRNHAEICHRHYEQENYHFEQKLTGNIRLSLILDNETLLPKVSENDVMRLKLLPQPTVHDLPSGQSVQELIQLFDPSSSTVSSDIPTQPSHLDVEAPDADMIDVDGPSEYFPHFTIDNEEEPEIESIVTQIPNFLLVEGKQLLQLFKHCYTCGDTVTASPTLKVCGTAIIIKFWCSSCNVYKKWSSQSKVENTERFVGNVLVPSTAVITPIDYPSLSEFAKTLGLPMIKWSTYNRVARRMYDVIEDEWETMQKRVIGDVIQKQEEGEETCISADCQFDSRGYCASQGCETIMCSKSMFVLTGHLLERTETNNNSGAMEVEGLKRCLEELKSKEIKVKVLTTDRSKSVISFMSQFKDIKHLFDPWHLFKSLNKAFREAAKLKTAAEMKIWIGPLLNHMWYSVKAANGDGDLCVQYIMTSLIHPLGIHEWQPGRLEDVLKEVHSKFQLDRRDKAKYKKNDPSTIKSNFVKDFPMSLSQCPHSYRPPNVVEDNRLPVHSKVYNVIMRTLTTEYIVKDMMKLSPNLTTSYLENLHSLITGKYRSKDVYYPKRHSMVLTYLAYYHHNMNLFDEIAGERVVVRKKLQKSRQRGGELTVKYVKTPPNLSWKIRFNDNLLDRYSKKVEPTDNVDDDGDEDEIVANIGIAHEYDEGLADDILDGNLPSEFIGLLNDEDLSDSDDDL